MSGNRNKGLNAKLSLNRNREQKSGSNQPNAFPKVIEEQPNSERLKVAARVASVTPHLASNLPLITIRPPNSGVSVVGQPEPPVSPPEHLQYHSLNIERQWPRTVQSSPVKGRRRFSQDSPEVLLQQLNVSQVLRDAPCRTIHPFEMSSSFQFKRTEKARHRLRSTEN